MTHAHSRGESNILLPRGNGKWNDPLKSSLGPLGCVSRSTVTPTGGIFWASDLEHGTVNWRVAVLLIFFYFKFCVSFRKMLKLHWIFKYFIATQQPNRNPANNLQCWSKLHLKITRNGEQEWIFDISNLQKCSPPLRAGALWCVLGEQFTACLLVFVLEFFL